MTEVSAAGRPPGRTVLGGAFALLHALPDVGGPHQVRDLSAVTGLPRATVYRLLAQLVDVGAVELRGGEYVPGPSMFALAPRLEPVRGLRRCATEVMRSLRSATGAMIVLVGPGSWGTVNLAVVPGAATSPVPMDIGGAVPAGAATSMLLDPSSDAGRIRRHPRAWTVDDEQCIPGFTCVATSVALPDGSTAALAITTPAAVPAVRFAPAVHRAAGALEGRLRDLKRAEAV